MHGSCDDDDFRRPCQSARERRQCIQAQCEDEHASLADKVGRPATEQQEAAAEHHVSTHHPLQRLPREMQASADIRKRDEHDVDVEGINELCEGEQRQRRSSTARHRWRP